MSCPPDEVLAGYLDDTLFLEDRLRVEQHVAGCCRCSMVFAEAVRFLGGDATDPPASRVACVLREAWHHIAASFARAVPHPRNAAGGAQRSARRFVSSV